MIKANGYLKYWPVILAVIVFIGGYAVLCRDVGLNTTTGQANVSRITECEKNQAAFKKDVEYIKDGIDSINKKLDQ